MDILGTDPKRRAWNAIDAERPEAVIGLRLQRGRSWFVDSNNTNSSRDGKSWAGAYTTIAAAVAVDQPDDVILVAPLHVETITAAAGLVLSRAGVTYVGLGNGNRRPQVNFTTAGGADMDVTGAGTRMINFRFTGGIDALTNPVHLAAADIQLLDVVTEDVTGQATDFIVTTDDCDRFVISGWQHRGAAAAGADTAISIVGGDDWLIENFDVYGNFAVAAIENVTTAGNRVRIRGGSAGSRIWTENAADIAITMVATTTGFIEGPINIMLQDNAANITEALVGAAMSFFQPLRLVNLAGESSMETNITASTDA
jgi:hypothetical protein